MILVVIEGIGKRETVNKYLGKGYEVFASGGHIRDLPEHSFGVDIKNNFQPMYKNMPDKEENIKFLTVLFHCQNIFALVWSQTHKRGR